MNPKWGHDDGTTDRYVAAASFTDGTPLNDIQRDRFLDKYPELTQELAVDQHFQQEGSCGYSQEAPGGKELDTPGGVQSMDADDRTKGMLKVLIQKEIAKLKEGNFDDRLKSMMGDDDFEKATSKDVPGLGDTVIDDKTNISTGRKTFMKMMMQFTDEPFLIETGLKLYDAWARGEGGLKPSRILKILQDTRN